MCTLQQEGKEHPPTSPYNPMEAMNCIYSAVLSLALALGCHDAH